jgi:hypothetical protein
MASSSFVLNTGAMPGDIHREENAAAMGGHCGGTRRKSGNAAELSPKVGDGLICQAAAVAV